MLAFSLLRSREHSASNAISFAVADWQGLTPRRWPLFRAAKGYLSAEHHCAMPDALGPWTATPSHEQPAGCQIYVCPECEMHWRRPDGAKSYQVSVLGLENNTSAMRARV